MRPIELLTAGLWHDSIGDMAITLAVTQQLALRGVPVVPCVRASGNRTCVIGGGALLTGERRGMWWHALQPYHCSGRHILNAVSVASEGDFEYLQDYLCVTVRDEPSRKRLEKFHPDVKCVPCCTVLLEPPDLEYYRNLPSYEFLNRIVDTEYVVVDIEIHKKVDIQEQIVIVDTRPWANRGKPDFSHRNTDAILAVILGAKAVIASSLHLSIMAMAMGVPFIYSKLGSASKGMAYYNRAGFQHIIHDGNDPVEDAVKLKPRMLEVREQEQKRAREHINRIVGFLQS